MKRAVDYWSRPGFRDRGYGVFEGVRLLTRDASLGFKSVLQRRAHRRVLCNSFPKSGTHLLYEALLGAGVYQPWDDIVSWQSLSGRANSFRHLQWKLRAAPDNSVVRAHVPFDPQITDTLASDRYAIVTIVRDPRDVIVSHAHWVRKEPRFYLHSVYRRSTLDEAIMMSAVGVPLGAVPYSNVSFPGVVEDMVRWNGWIEDPRNVVVRFEDLVGARGGSTTGRQEAAVRRIGAHIGWGDVELEACLATLRQGDGTESHTYRQGRIGAWADVLSADHLDAFASRGGAALLDTWGYAE